MKALNALGRGIGAALVRPGLLAVLTLGDLAVALVAVAPSYAALDAALSRRTDTPALARGFDFVAWLDVLSAQPGARAAWPYAMAAALVFAWIWGALSAAGWLSADARRGFWAGMGQYGLRFARLALGVGGGLVALEMGRGLLARMVTRWAAESTSAPTAFAATTGVAVLHGLLVLWLLTVSDVAKVRIRAEDRRSAFLAFFAALGWVVRRPLSTLGLSLVGAGLQLALLFAAGIATDETMGPTLAGFLVPFGVGQVFVAVRIAVRAGTLLGLARLYEGEDVVVEEV